MDVDFKTDDDGNFGRFGSKDGLAQVVSEPELAEVIISRTCLGHWTQ